MARPGVMGGAPRQAGALLLALLCLVLMASCTVVGAARDLDKLSMQIAPEEPVPVAEEVPAEPPEEPAEAVEDVEPAEAPDALPEGFQSWTLDEKLAYLMALAEPVAEESEEEPAEALQDAVVEPVAETVQPVPVEAVAPPPAPSPEPVSAEDVESGKIIRLGENIILPRWFVIWTFVFCFAILFTLCFISRQNRWNRWSRGRD